MDPFNVPDGRPLLSCVLPADLLLTFRWKYTDNLQAVRPLGGPGCFVLFATARIMKCSSPAAGLNPELGEELSFPTREVEAK
eukprot:s1008_g6.t1